MNLSRVLSLNEIAEAVKGEIFNNNDIKIKSIVTDSREILESSIYFALKGEIYDGHDFTAQAVENGAIAVVINKDYAFENKNNIAVITVSDTAQAFLDLAKYYKSLFDIKLTVGITGSNGKTTVKEFMHAVLSQKYKARKNEGNFNNEIGLPKTVFNLREDEHALVLEMGMNHLGEITRLSKAGEPGIGVINNIGTNHIENLGSQEGIKKAKFEILDGMSAEASIILNADDPFLYSEKNKTGKREYFFGIDNKSADYIAENISFDYESNESFFEISGVKFKIPVVGLHNVYNAMPAYIAGKLHGLSDELIQAGFNNFENAKMRQNIYEFNGIIIIDDCYNASRESVLVAFDVLCGIAEKTGGYKIAVLSDILEAGEYSKQIHDDIGVAAVEKNIGVYLYGEKSKATVDAIFRHSSGHYDAFYSPDKSDVASIIYGEGLKKGDVILFKASRGMAMETVLEDFKKLF